MLRIFILILVFLFPQTNASQQNAKTFLDLSIQNNNNPELAKEYAIKAIELAKNDKDETTETLSYYQLGSINIRQGNIQEALPNFQNGMQIAEKVQDKFLSAEGNYHLSRYHEGNRDFGKALDYLEQSLRNYKLLDKAKNVGYCYTSFGRIYQELGNYEKAMTNYFESLKISESLNNLSGVSVVKTNIGYVLMLTKKYGDAITYFSDALKLDSINKDEEGKFINLLNLGATYQKMGNYQNAIENFYSSMEIAKRMNYNQDIAILYGNIGAALMGMECYEEALDNLFLALNMEEKHNYNNSHTLNDISNTYLRSKNYTEAKKYAGLAIEASKQNNDLEQLRFAYLNVSNASKYDNDYKTAFEMLKLHNKVKDSIFDIDKEKQINNLQIDYKTEKKEQQISLLSLQKKTAEYRLTTYLIVGILFTTVLLLLYNNQRVKSLKNKQMFQKEREVTVMKSNFFSNISHEFRTPLTLILGPIQLLKEKVNDVKFQYHLDTMQRSANRLLSLIDQLLDLSKLESGKLELNKKEINIVSFVKGITMTFESLVETKNIQLSTISSTPIVMVNIDPEKLETIMINLLTNSFNYTPENGNIRVSVDTPETKNGQDVCQITVEDDGSGIPQEEIKNVFNKYYQSIAPDDGGSKGYGIGLALTKELVELHRGTIELFSEPRKGTKVVLKFPAGNVQKTMEINDPQKTPLDENSISREISLPEDLEDSRKERPIILLIEDNTDVMFYLEDIVGSKYQILKANNGGMGMEMAFEHIPDLIISDVMMPIKNGFEVCEALKLDERTSHVPIILLTAKASLDDKIKGLDLKADEYLTKPFVPKELLVRVKNLILSRRKLRECYNKELILKPDDVYVSSIDGKFLKKVKQVVEEYLGDETFNMEKLGEGVGMSRSQIHRKLHALTNQSASQFIRSYRLNRAIDLIRQNAASISEIAYTVGFSDPSYFSKCFHEEFGMTPREAQNTPK